MEDEKEQLTERILRLMKKVSHIVDIYSVMVVICMCEGLQPSVLRII